ncbi:MAG: response regulator transcription factor, partial [Sphingobacteriales bacterium]
RKLFIGLRTVEYYRGNLFLKLEVKNLAGLIRKALELGLVE